MREALPYFTAAKVRKALAPLPPESTLRYFIDYVSGERHTLMIRAEAALGPSGFGTAMDDFFTEIGPLMNSFAIEQVRVAVAGSNVSNVVVSGIEGNTYGAGGVTSGNDRSKFLGFVGRSTAGRKVSFRVYSVADINGSYRLDPSEAPNIGTAVAILNGTANLGLAVDGIKALWKSYANTTDDGYWQRRLRN